MTSEKITPEHLKRRAVVYVRQSTPGQVRHHQESTRLQYALTDRARKLGFNDVVVIDDDLGRSGAGFDVRAGFASLVGAVCAGEVGAVLSVEDARLARNGRETHHLIELCAVTGTLIIDTNGVYDVRIAQDRLLLGVKGSVAEFELSLFRQRSFEAIRAKASRGELRVRLPMGLQWTDDDKIVLDPDQRIQDAVRLVFRKYQELRSARQVLKWLFGMQLDLPGYNAGGTQMSWRRPRYSPILSMLANPFYAGAYAFGRTEVRTDVVDGRAQKTPGHRKALSDWTVLIRDHHPGYLSWADYERNQHLLAENAHMINSGTKKSGRGGRALLAGLLRCGHCGRRINVVYKGSTNRVARYVCNGANTESALNRCISFGGLRVDESISIEIVRALEPIAVDAAIQASQEAVIGDRDQLRAIELELEEARYAARLAARRYEAVDPDNRLVAAELEARWNEALRRAEELERKLCTKAVPTDHPTIDRDRLLALADDLPSLWREPTVEPAVRQRIVAILIEEVVANVEAESGETLLTIHWAGGRHSELKVPRNKPGHTAKWTEPEATEIIRRMGGDWPDRDIVLTLNRLRMRTGTGLTWTESRLRPVRVRLGLPAYDAERAKNRVSLHEAARIRGVSAGVIRRLVEQGELPASQVAPGAPWQILREDLDRPEIVQATEAAKNKASRSRPPSRDNGTPMIPGL